MNHGGLMAVQLYSIGENAEESTVYGKSHQTGSVNLTRGERHIPHVRHSPIDVTRWG